MTDVLEDHRRIERIALRAWPSAETVEYDGWILRSSGGYTKRANSVNPHFGSTLPLQEKIAHCEAFYAARELPTIFRLTPFSQPEGIDQMLADAGYTTLDPTLVMTAILDQASDKDPAAARFATDAVWLAAFEGLRRLPPDRRTHHRRIVETADGERLFALIVEDDNPVACGLGIVTEDILGLFDLFTAEAHRGRGHGGAIVCAIAHAAIARGTRQAFLQVHSQNETAQRLYRAFGYEIAYRYWYRIKPQSAGSQVPSSLSPPEEIASRDNAS